jgi:two-component sensor histidine kinase
MAVVSSLLSLQASKVDDLQVQMALQESQNRVLAMALIHESLYQSDNLAEIDLQKYIDRLLANLISVFGRPSGRIQFQVDAGGVELEVGKAVPCGLIINELITNTLKYAFPQGGDGRVSIGARRLGGGEAELVVSDTGVGFPPDLDLKKAKSLGLRLIGLMVEQLGGEWEVCNAGGAMVTIRCPLGNI